MCANLLDEQVCMCLQLFQPDGNGAEAMYHSALVTLQSVGSAQAHL
jgi:hypothetical protein